MAQNYQTVSAAYALSVLNGSILPDNFAALRSNFSGATAPSDTVAGQSHVNTADAVKQVRNVADDAWLNEHQFAIPILSGAVSGTLTRYLPLPWGCEFESLRVISDTATSGSDGSNNWTFDVYNITDSQSLFSSVPTTNGGELAVDTEVTYAADQNHTIQAADVLELRVTRNGTGTALSSASVLIYAVVTRRID